MPVIDSSPFVLLLLSIVALKLILMPAEAARASAETPWGSMCKVDRDRRARNRSLRV